jgi:hypothetical protein
MRNLLTYLLVLVTTITFGQKEDLKYESNWKAINGKYTAELINQILEDEKDNILKSNCISNVPIAISEIFTKKELKEIAHKELNVKKSSHLRKQIKLYKQFQISQEIVPNKNIAEIGVFEVYPEGCETGYCSISKPIFNETYDLAFIQLGNSCGMTCGGGIDRIYFKVDGIWKIKKVMSTWVK